MLLLLQYFISDLIIIEIKKGKITEYEFLVASLLTLNKLSKNDLSEIMSKFKELAGDDLCIDTNDIAVHHPEEESIVVDGRDFKDFEMRDL